MIVWLAIVGIAAQITGVVIISEPLWYRLAREYQDPNKASISMGKKSISYDFYLAVKKRAPKGIPLIIGGLVVEAVSLLIE